MSLRRVVAAPFVRRGADEVTRAEFLYTLTGDLSWFGTDEAEDALRAGVDESLLTEDGDGLRPVFDLSDVEIPEGFEPSVDTFEVGDGRGVFERAVERLVGAGYEKREAVAEINMTHADMDGARVEAAALLTAKREGLCVSDLAEEALEELRS